MIALIGLIAVVAAFWFTGDLRQIQNRLGGFAWRSCIAASGLALVNYTLRYARWAFYLRSQAIEVPARSRLSVFISGLSLSMTPAKVGELAKSLLLLEMEDVPVTRSAPVVIAERLTDLVSIVILATIGVAIYGVAVRATLLAAALVAAGLIALATPPVARAVIRAATHIRRARRFRDRLIEIYDGIVSLCAPRRLGIATMIGCVGWLCECIGFALIVGGFPGASIDVGLAMLIYAVTTLAGAMSFIPGGLGVTEGAMAVLLVNYAAGIDQASAIAAAVLHRICTLWFATAIGLAGMAWARRRITDRRSLSS